MVRSTIHGRSITATSCRAFDAELVLPDALRHPAAGRRRLLLVPVGRWDLRATRPVECSWRVTAAERRALHVAVDEQELWELGNAWLGSGARVPLHVVERTGSVAATLASVVELELAGGFDEVVVVTGRVDLSRHRYRLLHDRTADAIARAVGGIPNALVALVTVATV